MVCIRYERNHIMRRGQNKDVFKYIEVRVEQLKEDMDKAHDQHDKNWYNRLIQELNWAASPHHNCYMSKEVETDARTWPLI